MHVTNQLNVQKLNGEGNLSPQTPSHLSERHVSVEMSRTEGVHVSVHKQWKQQGQPGGLTHV